MGFAQDKDAAIRDPVDLQILRDKVNAVAGLNPKHISNFSHYPSGIPAGSLVELSGSAKLEWLVHFFKENPTLKIFWIEDKMTLLPTAIEQREVSLERFVFVESDKDFLKPLRQALKSKAFACVVAPRFTQDEKTLKVLQLLAEESLATVFLLTKKPIIAWPLSIQLSIEHEKNPPSAEKIFSVVTIKNKYI